MDNTTIKKYFKFGDEVEVSTPQATNIGKIVDFSEYVLVIEDLLGNPVMLSIDSIVSCKRVSDIETNNTNQEIDDLKMVDDTSLIIRDIVKSIDEIYEQCSIPNDAIIPTNATVIEMLPQGVKVLTDNEENIICVKSSFAGYSRDNAAVGKRVFCSPSKNNMSYASLTEMTFGEMYERFIRAINTKPKPRTPILGSILFLLTKVYGKSIINQKKTIKQLIRSLNSTDNSPLTQQSPSEGSKKQNLDALTIEQKGQLYELLNQHAQDFVGLPQSEQIKTADSLIHENLGIRIKRKSIKVLMKDLASNGSLPYSGKEGSSILPIGNPESSKNDVDPFLSATCEINKYFPKYQYGRASDKKVEEIRFKDDVVVEEELKEELLNFHFWEENVAPIPVICVYKKIGKWHMASLITKPGSLSDIRNRIQQLRAENRNELASTLQNFLDSKGFFEGVNQVNISLSSEELLNVSKRQRLIKNFEEAEIGFLEIIRRKYSLDVAVKDLAMMYQEWKKIPMAIDLLNKHLPELDDKMKVYNMLFTLYHTTGHDSEAISIMEEALGLFPGNDKTSVKQRNKIKRKIDYVKKKKRKAHFSSDDIPAPLLRNDANNTTGEVLAYISNKSYEEKLEFLNQRIGELRNSRELPAYYLAKIQLLEDNGEQSDSSQVKNLLADYCRAKARNFFYEDNSISAREYLLQGISVIEREDLYYFLYISLCTSSQEVLSKYNETNWRFEELSPNLALKEDDDTFYVLFRILKEDCTMSRKVLRLLYNSASLSWICDELDMEMNTPADFVDLMTNTATCFSSAVISFQQSIDRLLLLNNATEISTSLLNLDMPTPKQSSSLDLANKSLLIEVANNVLDLNKNIGYDECEDICRTAFSKVDSAVTLTQKSPTLISTLSFLPILLKLRDLMERALNKKYAETLPHIVIEPIDDARPIGDTIEIQISISNVFGVSRASNGKFVINSINDKDVSSLSLINVLESSLAGGDKATVVISLKSTLFHSDNIELDYTFNYLDVRKVAHTKQDKINIAINKGNNYEDFDNPFIAHVKSNAVKDKSMFKGREDIIDTICKCVLEDYKGFVLYGQKRSGKSSVLYHITQRLRTEHKAFAVEYTMGNNIVQDSESEKESMANLFYTIISEIGRAIKEVDRNVYKESGCHIIRRHEFENYPDQTFKEYLDFYRDIIVDKLHYEQDKIVLIVDEFTYLYYHILEGKISSSIMEFWKGLVESRIFSFVFAGQDAMPRFMDDFQNVFASMDNKELSYIDETSARELIEEPIWDNKNNCSRFHPDAVNEIIKLTACSPFYIMILCSELVKYARQRKRLPIQVSDVNALVQRMICNESSISRKDFDNLISCGESRLDIIDKDDSLKVLKDIAVKSRNVDYYNVADINVFSIEKVKSIINDLLRRGVLEPHPEIPNKVRIKVGLFKRWLLNHE